MKNAYLSAVLVLAVAYSFSSPGWAAPPKKHAAAPKSDVVVKKNADGTVEVTDADNQQAAPSGGGVTYRPAPPGTIHYSDGVVVKRNADGSVEVTDEDSEHPAMHTLGAPTVSTVHRHHATTHSGTKKVTHTTASKQAK